MAADEMGLPLGGGRSTGRLVAVLDVGGRTAQCSIVDAGIKVGRNWTREIGVGLQGSTVGPVRLELSVGLYLKL